MKLVLFVVFLGLSNSTLIAQLRAGFDLGEAKSLIAICNSFTFLELYGSDTLIVPKEYHKTFTSEENALDNIFQVYENDINYVQTGYVRELEPFPFPKVQADALNMTKKRIAKPEQDKGGNYHKSRSIIFQHKPYQYYLAILKEYYSREFGILMVPLRPLISAEGSKINS